ncbi:hypothetical protein BC834DRAFT_300511 [Gloeopeniophorella convolvens]|nr:hypothetical protein BC834DRAFT_300511 [Gloeopeniophorella convolvens]
MPMHTGPADSAPVLYSLPGMPARLTSTMCLAVRVLMVQPWLRTRGCSCLPDPLLVACAHSFVPASHYAAATQIYLTALALALVSCPYLPRLSGSMSLSSSGRGHSRCWRGAECKFRHRHGVHVHPFVHPYARTRPHRSAPRFRHRLAQLPSSSPTTHPCTCTTHLPHQDLQAAPQHHCARPPSTSTKTRPGTSTLRVACAACARAHASLRARLRGRTRAPLSAVPRVRHTVYSTTLRGAPATSCRTHFRPPSCARRGGPRRCHRRCGVPYSVPRGAPLGGHALHTLKDGGRASCDAAPRAAHPARCRGRRARGFPPSQYLPSLPHSITTGYFFVMSRTPPPIAFMFRNKTWSVILSEQRARAELKSRRRMNGSPVRTMGPVLKGAERC